MKLLYGLVGAVCALAACTSPNPRSCIDGICSDERYPFCDADGSLAGTPKTCIAVECNAGEFVKCTSSVGGGSADEKLTCNATGNNYDTTACPNGCDEAIMGCTVPPPPPMGCQMSSECTNADAPFCDPSDETCRKCEANSECSSDLCDVDSGRCVAEADIIYASPTGATSGCGARTTPCSLSAAFALLDATHHIIRAASGNYAADNLPVGNVQAKVYADGTTLATTTGATFALSGSVNLLVRGATINVATGAQFIGGTTNGTASTIVGFDHINLSVNSGVSVGNYSLTIDHSTVSAADAMSGFSLLNGVVTIRHSTLEKMGFTVNNGQFHVSNCLFRNAFQMVTILNPNGGVSDISFSTFIDTPFDMTVSATVGSVVTLNNTIHVGQGPTHTSVMRGNAFTTHYAIMTPQNVAPTNSDHVQLDVNPNFVNAATNDYHLQVGSPGIDAADPGFVISDDHDGVLRPIGNGRDLGAFESH